MNIVAKSCMTIEEFLDIKQKLNVTYDVMAEALGVSKRSLQRYREGKTPISRSKALLIRQYAKGK